MAYRLNSLFAPGVAGGHQPYGFDQYCPTLYLRYKVWNVTVHLSFYDPSADGIYCGAVLAPAGTTATLTGATVQSITEAPFSVAKPLSNTGSQKTVVYAKYAMHTLFGVSREQFRDDLDSTTGSGAGSPGTTPYLYVAACNPRGTASSVFCQLKLTYWAQLYQRVTLAPS